MAAKKPVNEVVYKDAEEKKQYEMLIGQWWGAVAEAARAVELESELRAKVFDKLYPLDDPKRNEPGSEHFAMPGGWVLKIERKINTTIDKAALDVVKKIAATLEPDEDGVVPSLDPVIRYEPKFSDSGYRDAHPKIKELLAENHVLTSNPGKPAIKLELPKSAQPKPVAKAAE